MQRDAMNYITKIETILICNNFRPNGIAFCSQPPTFLVFEDFNPWFISLDVTISASKPKPFKTRCLDQAS